MENINLNLNWHASINAAGELSTDKSLRISGELVNAEVCANNFALDESELTSVANQLKDATLRVDHSKFARDVIGGVCSGRHDEEKKKIIF